MASRALEAGALLNDTVRRVTPSPDYLASAPRKALETQALLIAALESATASPAAWRDYLAFVSRVYKYSPLNAALIHAQRPDATAVAPLDTWNKRVNRWVNRGSKGIALIDENARSLDYGMFSTYLTRTALLIPSDWTTRSLRAVPAPQERYFDIIQ